MRKLRNEPAINSKMVDLNDLVHLNALNVLQEAEILANNPPRRLNRFLDPFEYYSDREFVRLYRLSKPVASDLIDILEPHLRAPSRASALSIPQKVCINYYEVN